MIHQTDLMLIDSPNKVADYPPLGVALLSAVTRDRGFTVDQRDLNITLRDNLVTAEELCILRERFIPLATRTILFANDPNELVPRLDKLAKLLTAHARDDFARLIGVKRAMQQRQFAEVFGDEGMATALEDLIHFEQWATAAIDAAVLYPSLEAGCPEYLPYRIQNDLLRDIGRSPPQYVGFSVTALNRAFVWRLTERVAAAVGDETVIILGGPDATYNGESFLRRWGWVDAVVLSEGDDALPALLETQPERWSEVPNLAFRRGEEIVKTPKATPKIPACTPAFVDTHRYLSDMLPVQASRGCSWARCKFCAHFRNYSKNYVAQEPAVVVDQIEDMIRTYGTRRFHFCDDEMPPALKDGIAQEILHRGIDGLSLLAYSRFEADIDRKRLETWYDAGFHVIEFGLECASQTVIDRVDKGIRLSDAERILRDAADVGILSKVFMFHNGPGETVEDLLSSAKFLTKYTLAGIIRPFFELNTRFELLRGSPLYRTAMSPGAKDSTFSKVWEPRGDHDAQAGYAYASDGCGKEEILTEQMSVLANLARRFDVLFMNDEAISLDLILEDLQASGIALTRTTRLQGAARRSAEC